jgi:phage gp36-like protein
VAFLKMVAKGEIDLGAATPAPNTTGHSVEIESSERIFSRDKMSGF